MLLMLLCLFGKITLLRFVRENVALVGHWFLPSIDRGPSQTAAGLFVIPG